MGDVAVEDAIERWLTAVRDAQRFARRLPVLGWCPVETEGPAATKGPLGTAVPAEAPASEATEGDRGGGPIGTDGPAATAGQVDPPDGGGGRRVRVAGRRLVARPLVIAHLDSHVARRLTELRRYLQVEALSIAVDAPAVRRRDVLGLVTEFLAERRSVRARAAVAKFVLPFVLFVVGPAALLDGFDAEDARRAFTAIVLLVSLPVYALALWMVSVPMGFIPKRALWGGGRTVIALDACGERRRDWLGFPAADIYRLEAELFELIGETPRPERALDISAGTDVFTGLLCAAIAVGIGVGWAADGPSGWLIIGTLVGAGFIASQIQDLRSRHQLRALRRNSRSPRQPEIHA